MTMRRHRALAATALALSATVIAGCGGGAGDAGGTGGTGARAALVRTVHVDADHPTFDTVAAVRGEADVVVVGTVLSQSVDPGTSPGTDDAGDPLPPIPHTRYVVRVDRAIKGTAAQTITVTLGGGAVNGERFVVDGGPVLADGSTSMFFLRRGDDGDYYPLAGGAAVAARQADGSFALPSEAATGAAALAVTPDGFAPSGGGSPTGGGSTPPSGGGTTSGASGRPLAIALKLASRQTRATTLSRGLRLVVTCSSPCRLFGQVIATPATAKAIRLTRKARRTVVASGTATRAGTVVLRFTRAAAKALRRRARTKLSVAVIGTDAKGASATARGVLDLKRSTVALRKA